MFRRISTIVFAASALAVAGGCATDAGTGAAWGAGIGAIAGGLYGGHGSDALIGAAVGTGIGYLIGNESDKKKAQQMSTQTAPSYVHHETGTLGGTKWRLIDWSRKDGGRDDFDGKTFAFGADGWVTTTTSYKDGRSAMEREHYRVVGDKLIVNKGDYLVNYTMRRQGNQLEVRSEQGWAALGRM